MRIALDFAGSETSPEVFMEAISRIVKRHPSLRFLLLVPRGYPLLVPASIAFCVEVGLADAVVAMEDSPLLAVRDKPQASLFVALAALKNADVQACISTGNTGALIAGAHLWLPLFKGLKRLSLLANIPLAEKPLTLIDAGASLCSRVSHLVQFAQLGTAYQKLRFGVTEPRVGLLNIGQEAEKGPKELKKAYQALSEMHDQKKILFYGNVEANQVFDGRVQVLVTPGFSGNLFLKTAEGVWGFLQPQLSLPYCCSSSVGSGLVMGARSLLLKCHGHSSVEAIFQAMEEAWFLSKQGFVEKMQEACWK